MTKEPLVVCDTMKEAHPLSTRGKREVLWHYCTNWRPVEAVLRHTRGSHADDPSDTTPCDCGATVEASAPAAPPVSVTTDGPIDAVSQGVIDAALLSGKLLSMDEVFATDAAPKDQTQAIPPGEDAEYRAKKLYGRLLQAHDVAIKIPGSTKVDFPDFGSGFTEQKFIELVAPLYATPSVDQTQAIEEALLVAVDEAIISHAVDYKAHIVFPIELRETIMAAILPILRSGRER